MAKKDEDTKVARQIDDNLRRVFQEKIEEEIPDRFQQLLEKLRSSDASNEDTNSK